MDRSETSYHYAIRGGEAGKERLDLLARVLLPSTLQLLNRVGLTKGMKCLDIGCGGGHVAILIAGIVGPEGRVIGSDVDGEILALAQKDSQAAKLTNVEFQQVDACVCAWQEEFDLIYSRFLLSHLSNPNDCLAAVIKACRPGGTIVIEDTDFDGSFCYPPCAAYERYKELYQKVVQRNGGDPNIGPKLPAIARKAGIQRIQVNVIQPADIRGDAKLMAPVTMLRISDALITEGLSSEAEVQEILDQLNEVAGDCETVMSLPRIFQIWGERGASDRNTKSN
jgi:SAM-dependent methyltransferase